MLRSDPDNVEILHLLGVLSSQLGHHPRAIDYIGKAISIRQDIPVFHYNLGVSLEEVGKLHEAADSYGKAGSLDISYADAFLNRGNCLHRLGDVLAAADSFRSAINARPEYAAAHSNLGNVLHELGCLDESVLSHRQAVSIEPDSALFHFNLGNTLKELGQFQSALDHFDQAVTLRPEYVAAVLNRGGALMKLRRYEDALLNFDAVIVRQPTDPQAFSNKGIALAAIRRFEDAIISFEQAIHLDPDDSQLYMNFGVALIGAGQYDRAIQNLRRAVSINPSYAEAFSNLGSALKQVGEFTAAFDHYQRAIALDPELAEAHWNLGLTQLLLGNFNEGLPRYEWRWKTSDQSQFKRYFEQPMWTGAQSLEGKVVLVYAEQGLGDTIQFVRYIPLMAQMGATVLMEVPFALRGLLHHLPGVSRFIVQGETLPWTDFHCPLLSLPLLFKTDLASIPPVVDLPLDFSRVAAWSARLGARVNPRIGIVWSGNPHHTNDRNRSIPLERFLSQLPEQFDYVSLQRDVRETDWALLRSHPRVRHFGQELSDLVDTAALCTLLDLVVCVDTCVAHLAGTLSKKTWILLPWLPDWRWQMKGQESAWYTTATLYRQPFPGAWDPVLKQIGTDLQANWRLS
jgi:tetratricopeptide (TPR) repeat protein